MIRNLDEKLYWFGRKIFWSGPKNGFFWMPEEGHTRLDSSILYDLFTCFQKYFQVEIDRKWWNMRGVAPKFFLKKQSLGYNLLAPPPGTRVRFGLLLNYDKECFSIRSYKVVHYYQSSYFLLKLWTIISLHFYFYLLLGNRQGIKASEILTAMSGSYGQACHPRIYSFYRLVIQGIFF